MVTLPAERISTLSLLHVIEGMGFPVGWQFSSSCCPCMAVVVAGGGKLGATGEGRGGRKEGRVGGINDKHGGKYIDQLK